MIMSQKLLCVSVVRIFWLHPSFEVLQFQQQRRLGLLVSLLAWLSVATGLWKCSIYSHRQALSELIFVVALPECQDASTMDHDDQSAYHSVFNSSS